MTTPSLSLTYGVLWNRVAYVIGWTTPTAAQEIIAQNCATIGLRRFLAPPPVPHPDDPKKPYSHVWSFLTKTASIASTGDLPADFGEIVGKFTYTGGSAEVLPEEEFAAKAAEGVSGSGTPRIATIYASATSDYLKAVKFYPTGAATMTYRYKRLIDDTTTTDATYIQGLQDYNDALMECCLAVAEEQVDDFASTTHGTLAQKALVEAIYRDYRANKTGGLEYNTATYGTWGDLVFATADAMGVGAMPTGQHRKRAEDFVRAGYYAFVHPVASINGRMVSHEWSFLSPNAAAVITTVSGDEDYDAPQDCGGVLNGKMYFAATLTLPPMREKSRLLVESWTREAPTSGRPEVFCIRPVTFVNTTGNKREFLFYPKPDAAYLLTYAYRREQDVLNFTTANYGKFPLGYPDHFEVIKALCIAAAVGGVASEHAQRLLLAAIIRDRELYPRDLGRLPDGEGVSPINPHSMKSSMSFDGVTLW